MSNYSEQFLKQTPLAVLGVLRDLHKNQVPVRLTWGSGQIISKVLEVSTTHLVMDLGSQAQENLSAQQATDIQFTAEMQGAKVEFILPKVRAAEHQDLPAFNAPLPETLWFVQRREFFRINAPIQPAYYCHTVLPDGTPFDFRLFDLSVGGMGALVDGPLPAGVESGMRFSRVEIDLAQWGKFYFDMQLLMLSEHKVVGSKNETITTPRLSFRFLNVSPDVARELQRVIFSLERSAKEKADRVR